jgi:hypothetical protein
MPTIEGYNRFGGTHWETASICNVLAHQAVKAPHTREPLSEAMLLGLSGGVTSMYFVFEYEGYDPHVFIGTRYPFDPMGAMLKRLRIEVTVRETTSRDRAAEVLKGALADGQVPIVWANVYGLRYNALPDLQFPGMMPIVVYGYEDAANTVDISDRARVPLTSTVNELAEARAAQGSLKNRVLTFYPPAGLENLPEAVEESIRACVKINTEAPEKGPRGNFGLAALRKWADLMVDARDKKGWPRVFAPGVNMYLGLLWAYKLIEHWGTGGSGSRPMYADFLDEAAVLLNKPALNEVAAQFRESGEFWSNLAGALLPDNVPLLKETRDLLVRKESLFREQGMDALAEMEQIAANLSDIKAEMAAGFPLTEEDAAGLREQLCERILQVHEAEQRAFETLQMAVT